jgi:non-ribosomal peptide synthetase component E (peptide arylation enzyme)
VPERLQIVEEIPRNDLGKIDRKSLLGMMPDTVRETAAAL